MIELGYLTPAAEQAWWTLFELALDRPKAWVLVGGQMIYLLATEHDVELHGRQTTWTLSSTLERSREEPSS